MEGIIHNRIEVLEEIMPKKEQLNEMFHETTVFQSIDWMKSWLEYKKKSKEIIPYIVEIVEGHKTVGIFPLYLSEKEFANFHFRVLRPIGDVESDYLLPILSKEHSSEEILKKAVETVFKDKENWDCIDWGDIPKNSIFDKVLSNFLTNPYSTFITRKKTEVCPFLMLNHDFGTIKHKIDKQLLGQTLSKEKKMIKNGQLKLCKVEKSIEIDSVMEKLFDIHCERWRNTRTPSKFESIEMRKYTLQVAKRLHKTGLLHLTYLRQNNKIISVHFGMADGKRLYFYTPAFDINFQKYSVGSILMYRLIQLSCQEGYEVFDFMRGNEGYKWLWGAEEKSNVRYTVFNNKARSLLFKLVRKTYHSSYFYQKPIVYRACVKVLIRVTTLIFSNYNKLVIKRNI